MTISHPPHPADSDKAFVFAQLGGFTCSICAPASWDVLKVIDYAESYFPTKRPMMRWVSVDTAELLKTKGHTPNPCNAAPELRTHWFMMRGET